ALFGHDDIRSQYTQASYHKAAWKLIQGTVSKMANPNNDPDWKTLQNEMVQELGYVATVRGWFDNNYSVMHNSYDGSGNQLTQATAAVDLSTSQSVVSKWLEFAADIVSGIAQFFPEGGPSTNLIITLLEGTYNNVAGSDGDINQQISQITTDLNNQDASLIKMNAAQQTAYLTDYSKLQQIPQEVAAGGYDWSDDTLDYVAKAENGAANGQLINFYRMLLPAKWQVYWCDDNTPAGPDCGDSYTESKYNCQFGFLYQGVTPPPYNSNAYIYAGSSYVNWSLLDILTGPLATGPDNLNAIWYMMLLGGDLGWDLPQYGSTSPFGPTLHTPDPHLAYDQIEYGYKGPSSSCSGNGSYNGIKSANQALSARLSVAQQNSARITASEAPGILQEIHALKEEAKTVSPDSAVELDLTSPLREAVKLVAPVQPQTTTGEEPSVSATTPTHLIELFIRRAQLLTPRLGEGPAQHLTTHAYCLMGKLEGQSQAGESCRR
ncbi:MAG: hypothetical protein WA510_24330, partial [Acidobacteriaceae bacterium]